MTLAAFALVGCPGPETPGMIDAPTVDTVPARTNADPLHLEGTGVAGLTIDVRGGAGSLVSAVVDTDGRFSLDVALMQNAENVLLVTQRDDDGNESTQVMIRVTHDGIGPDAPTLDPVASPTRRMTTRLRGTAEAGATVSVSGGAEPATATAGADGRFDVTVALMTSAAAAIDNDLSVVATDDVGNEGTAATVRVVFDPTLAIETPLVDAIAPTSSTMVRVTGSAEPDAAISISGAVAPGVGMADASGAFGIDVELHPNTANTLFVFATLGGATSAPAGLVVVHDDVAPDAPSLDPQPAATSLATLAITGTSEPGASISITGGAADASGTADGDGRFDIDVMLNADVENTLAAIASDVAGNASEMASLVVTHDSALEAPVSLDPLTSPTAENPIRVRGTGTADSMIEIIGGASTVTVMAGADGRFDTMVMLRPNTSNELHVRRVGSGADTVVVVVHDSVAPDAPAVDTLPSPTSETMLTVRGTSEPRARISVTGATAAATGTAGDDGRFAIAVTIAEETTTSLSVIATDRAGNSSAPRVAMVRHSGATPAAPTLDMPSPPPTSSATFTVTGRVPEPAAGVTVRITGGAAMATGSTDPATGVFSVEVMLNANVSNELSVVSVAGAIVSPPAIATITHDDIAPDAPDSSRISATGPAVCLIRTGVTVTGTMGAAESRASVRIRNMATSTSVMTSATDGGSFTTTIAACPGDILSVVATDAAGNASAASEVTVM